MTDRNRTYDAAEHETFGFVDDEQPNEEGLEAAILDADDYRGADKHGMTPREEQQGTPLEDQLAAEVPETGDDPGDPAPSESDPLAPVPDTPADPNDPDPVPPEPVDPHEPDPTAPEPGEPVEYDPFRPLPDEPVPPRP